MRTLNACSLACLFAASVAGCSPLDNEDSSPPAAKTPAAKTPAAKTPADPAPPAEAGASTAAENEEFVIDVRSQQEWDEGHVEQAFHIPHTEIGERIGEVTEDKDARIVLYCRSGGRAGTAQAALEELGFTNVENAGGYEDVKSRFSGEQQ